MIDKKQQMIEQIAAMNYDCEKMEDGTEFDMTSDDAVESLNQLIRNARELIGVIE